MSSSSATGAASSSSLFPAIEISTATTSVAAASATQASAGSGTATASSSAFVVVLSESKNAKVDDKERDGESHVLHLLKTGRGIKTSDAFERDLGSVEALEALAKKLKLKKLAAALLAQSQGPLPPHEND